MRSKTSCIFSFFLSTFPFGFCFVPFLISFPICFSFFSHFSFFFSSFLPIFSFLFDFLSSFLNHYTYETNMRKFPPHLPQAKHVALPFSSFSFISYFFISFMTSSTQVAHCEPWDHATHVAQREPFLLCQVSRLLRCHVASPYLAMCHPTPHVSKNVKSRPPRNPTKFDVVAKFREMISTEKSV